LYDVIFKILLILFTLNRSISVKNFFLNGLKLSYRIVHITSNFLSVWDSILGARFKCVSVCVGTLQGASLYGRVFVRMFGQTWARQCNWYALDHNHSSHFAAALTGLNVDVASSGSALSIASRVAFF